MKSEMYWLIATKLYHDDVIKWKHFPRNWPFVRKIHRSPVNFPHKGQWRGALMFSLIYVWINDWANNREAGDLRRQHGHYDVIVMIRFIFLRMKSGVNILKRELFKWALHKTYYQRFTSTIMIASFLVCKPNKRTWPSRTLQWRHNERDGVSNHQPHDCLLNCLSRRRSKKKNQSSASLAFVSEIHWWSANSPHKGPVMRKMFPFGDVIMNYRSFCGWSLAPF